MVLFGSFYLTQVAVVPLCFFLCVFSILELCLTFFKNAKMIVSYAVFSPGQTKNGVFTPPPLCAVSVFVGQKKR